MFHKSQRNMSTTYFATRPIFLLRKYIKVWKLFERSGPNRSPNGLRLDYILDHGRSNRTPIWTTNGPFGPHLVHFGPIVVQMDRSWSKLTVVWSKPESKRTPFGPRFGLRHVWLDQKSIVCVARDGNCLHTISGPYGRIPN